MTAVIAILVLGWLGWCFVLDPYYKRAAEEEKRAKSRQVAEALREAERQERERQNAADNTRLARALREAERQERERPATEERERHRVEGERLHKEGERLLVEIDRQRVLAAKERERQRAIVAESLERLRTIAPEKLEFLLRLPELTAEERVRLQVLEAEERECQRVLEAEELVLEAEERQRQRVLKAEERDRFLKELEELRKIPTSLSKDIRGRRIKRQVKMIAVDNHKSQGDAELAFFREVRGCGATGVVYMRVRQQNGFVSIQGDAVVLE